MKKLAAILFACTMFICSAVSCGDKNDGEASSDSKTKVTTAAEETTAEKTTEKTDSDNKDDDKDDDDKNDGEKEDENAGIVDKEASDDVIKEMNAAVTEFAEMTLRGDADELINSMYPIFNLKILDFDISYRLGIIAVVVDGVCVGFSGFYVANAEV